jgi:cellulose synthase/poly-beta-1,6-N-acetylglucosamine synthase-like glycosyltransferase
MWPFGPYQLSLIIARRLHRFPATPNTNGRTLDATGCTFAICLCVYNEEAVIAKKMDDILALQETMEGELEILVYVDAASDGTRTILEKYKDRIRLFESAERRGKTYGMNLLVSQTAAVCS